MNWKRMRRSAVLFCFMVVLLAETAFANSAPPDYRLVIRLANGPEEPYYLDILAEGEPDSNAPVYGNVPNPRLLELLRGAIPEGWKACTLSRSVEGDLTGQDGVHRFSGFGTPKEYRILAVTESGETWVSDVMERRVWQDAAKVDWRAKNVTTASLPLAVALQTLSTLLPTLAVEGLVMLLFGISWKKNWKTFLLVNLLTQGALAVFLSVMLVRGAGGYDFIFFPIFFAPVELAIAFAEAYLYTRRFVWPEGQSEGRIFSYGIVTNIASYLLGIRFVPMVWEEFVRRFWLGI